jgi:hypothetical protein
MKHFINYGPILLLATGLALGLLLGGADQWTTGPLALQAQAQEPLKKAPTLETRKWN